MERTPADDTASQVQRLSDALDCISEAYFAVDQEWRFTHVNARAQALFGCRREVLLGEVLMEKIPEMGEEVFHKELERAMAGGEVCSFDACYPPNGALQRVRVFPTQPGLAVFLRDVTQARVPEQRLLEEQETLLAVVKSTNDAIISTDLGGRIKMFNPGAERIFRRSQASVLNQGMEMLMPERFRNAHAQHQHLFAQSTEPRRMMGLGLVKGLRSDGQEIDLEGAITHVTVAQRKILIASLRDVTERMRADAEVELSRQQLSDLTQRLMRQEKALVKRLAQVLHDQLGQTVAAIRVAHETILTLQGADVPAPVERLQTQLGTLVAQAVRQVRQVLIDLRPPLLEEQGLSAALDNELRNRSLTHPDTDIAIHIDAQVAHIRWPAEVEYAGFMVVREAVENALRHSDASSVSVRVRGSSRSLVLEVADDGTGLVPAAMLRVGHLGMRDMRERASGVGATLVVDSGGGAVGTRVTFNWESEV